MDGRGLVVGEGLLQLVDGAVDVLDGGDAVAAEIMGGRLQGLAGLVKFAEGLVDQRVPFLARGGRRGGRRHRGRGGGSGLANRRDLGAALGRVELEGEVELFEGLVDVLDGGNAVAAVVVSGLLQVHLGLAQFADGPVDVWVALALGLDRRLALARLGGAGRGAQEQTHSQEQTRRQGQDATAQLRCEHGSSPVRNVSSDLPFRTRFNHPAGYRFRDRRDNPQVVRAKKSLHL